MSKAVEFNPAKIKAACDKALAGVLDGLDREHYPASLYALLRKVLFPEEGSLRATALLTAAAGSYRGCPPMNEDIMAAQEMLLRGWLLQSVFVGGRMESGNDGLIRLITAEYPEALVLLAADTLFTLPFEILSGRGGDTAVEVTVRFAEKFGPGGLLRGLDNAGETLEDFLVENPLLTLAEAAFPGLPDGYAFAVLARYCWLREARDWFGREQPVRCGLAGAIDRRDCLGLDANSPPGSLYMALYRHLGK
jgi:hypothetical protein